MTTESNQPNQPAGSIAAIVPAAGSGQRFGSAQNKLFALLAGTPLWFQSISRMRNHPLIGRIVMPVSQRDHAVFSAGEAAGLVDELDVEVIIGGKERTESVRLGLDHLADDAAVQYIAVHDAARPLVSTADLNSVIAAASNTGAAILATPVSGTVKRESGNSGHSYTVDRRGLWIAMTPQVFRVGLLSDAYKKHNGRPATDDAELVERAGHDVTLVRGSAENLKITYPEDLSIAAAILARQMQDA